MKEVRCFEDNEGRRHDTPQDAAIADRVIAMRALSKNLIDEWDRGDFGGWQPNVSDLSVILQRLAQSKGFAILRKVQDIQRKESRILDEYKDDIPF